MGRSDWRLAWAVAVVGLGCLLWLLVAAGLLRLVLAPPAWASLVEALDGRAGLLLLLWALTLVPVTVALRELFERHVLAPARLAEAARVRLSAGVHQPLVPSGSAEIRELTEVVNALVAECEALRADMDRRVEAASHQVDLERRRLAALMAELGTPVVVCNLEGRVLLYNNRARLQFKGFSANTEVTGAAGPIGLGRSIYALLDRQLVEQALENVVRRLRRGAADPVAQFVTVMPTDHRLRVHLAPVRSDETPPAGSPSGELDGFVLLIENITREHREAAERERLLAGVLQRAGDALAEAEAAGLALRAADPAASARLSAAHAVVHREIGSLVASPLFGRQGVSPEHMPVDELPQLPAAGIVRHDSRPVYYDFDLFSAHAPSASLEESRLADLVYTVFDTETTGLAPSEGDEILQLGAVRIVNGRVLASESFEQLVNPGRGIPAAGIPIHGITPERVQGQPPIAAVLPTFHAYCRDTVLVAHNAAFDMRFLELKQAQAGVVFDQPVLDTLLLSAVVHQHQASHRLEAIAERFGLQVIGRHTAIGDALLTAEIFVRLLPLLADRGIMTLGQALAASRQTPFARQRY